MYSDKVWLDKLVSDIEQVIVGALRDHDGYVPAPNLKQVGWMNDRRCFLPMFGTERDDDYRKDPDWHPVWQFV